MGKTADAVVAAVAAAGHGETKAVTDFKTLVHQIDENARAAEEQAANEPTEAVREPLVITGVEVAANDNVAVAPLPAPSDGTEVASSTDAPTDDTRAPLKLPAVAVASTPKAPRKPLINWLAVQGTMKAVGNSIKQVVGRAGNLVGSLVVGMIVVIFYGILQLIPGIVYALAWTTKELHKAWDNGWNQRPLLNNVTPTWKKETPAAAPEAVVA